MNRGDLIPLVEAAVHHYHGQADHMAVAKYIWERHEGDLRRNERFFYKWQYEARWAADELRRRGILEPISVSGRGVLKLRTR
jgi:hypothetical protein